MAKKATRKKAPRRPAGAPGATGAAALTAWFCYALTTVVLALGVTWALYAQADYGYAFWYKTLDIDRHIEQYGPLNRFQRADFEALDADQHIELFHRIRVAVHDGGEGLGSIRYPDRQGTPCCGPPKCNTCATSPVLSTAVAGPWRWPSWSGCRWPPGWPAGLRRIGGGGRWSL